MKNVIGIFTLFLLFRFFEMQAQSGRPLVVSVFDNATLLPGADQLIIAGLPIHPGFTVGTEFRYNKNEHNRLFQTARLGYQYHRFMQQTVQLYTEFGYRRYLGERWDLEARIGGGYLHAFTYKGLYAQNADGQYEKKGCWGRPQGIISLAMGLGVRVAGTPEKPIRVFLNYQFYMQTPFVPGYVPLLPNTALHLGVSFPFFHR